MTDRIREEFRKAIDEASIEEEGHYYRFRHAPAWDEAYDRLMVAAADAILARLDSLGYVIVPKEPTEAMIGRGSWVSVGMDKPQRLERTVGEGVAEVYRAMIGAKG